MATIEVRTQAALDKAVEGAKAGDIIACIGKGSFVVSDSATVEASDSATVRASDSATVRAWGSATVEAWDSATVRAWDSATVEASDSATVRASDSATVEAWGSATVRASDSATVRAWDSATVEASDSATVRAWDSATVRAWDSATVRASKYVAIHVDRNHPGAPTISGGVLIEIPKIETAEQWCDYYGVEVADGIATLYKAVDDDYATGQSRASRTGAIHYRPETSGQATYAWDPIPECGNGLHFSPRPRMARDFNPSATRYVACPVLSAEIVVHNPAIYPAKVKAPRIVGPIVEVTIDGEPVVAP